MKHKKNGKTYNNHFRKTMANLYQSSQRVKRVKGLSNEYGVPVGFIN